MANTPDQRSAAPADASKTGNHNANDNATDHDTRRGQGDELQQQAGGSHPKS